jgi:DNA-binding transcriptional LysR family regulator
MEGRLISLDLLASFAAAARHGGFANAARDLGRSPSAVAKNIARLEAQLGVRLFHRTTRQVTLSPDGESLFARCERILEELAAVEADLAGAGKEPTGTLRIDMPVTYGRDMVLPVLTSLMAKHHRLKLDARFSDQFVDVVKEGLDAAVRIGPLSDSRLVGRRFDRHVIAAFASPEYLAEHGEPGSPEALSEHACLLFRLPSTGRDRTWQFRRGKRDVSLLPKSDMRLGDGEALVHAAAAGLGVIQVPEYMARTEVRNGRLIEILRKYRSPPLPVSLVYPSHRHVPLRVRVVADALAAARRETESTSA